MLQLPYTELSIWQEDNFEQVYPSLETDLEADVAVIGGGITGLTAAYLLKKSGLNNWCRYDRSHYRQSLITA
jgi:ribulose 1,5-bisphosphate synthetase/thiazole synthase